MKLEKLEKKAVRSTQPNRDAARLDDATLTQVVAGAEVCPPTCEIHFYYPADAME